MCVGAGRLLAEPGPDGVQQRDDPVRGDGGGGAGRPTVRNGGRGRGHHRPSTHPGKTDRSNTQDTFVFWEVVHWKMAFAQKKFSKEDQPDS